MAKRLEETWPASKVALWPIEKIRPYEKNPRQHSQAQIDLIASSMKDDGVTAPILVDEAGVIIYGHGRRLAALQNGYTRYPVAVAIGWSEEKKRAVRIKDNSYAELSTWGVELITAELKDLKLAGYDVPLLGFPESQLRGWGVQMGTEGQADPEATPEPPKKPVVRRGDRWVLGDHILVCGDATSESDVAMCMGGGAQADLVFTDPPYNLAYSGLGQNRLGTIKNDDMSEKDFAAFLRSSFEVIAANMKNLASIYVCHPDAASGPKLAFERAFAEFFTKSATIIWVKQAAGMGWQDYRSQHEPMLYGWKPGKGKYRFYGDRTKTTVWTLNRDAQKSDYEHPTQKPVALAAEAIANSSKVSQIVFDPFVGAGGSIIACEMNSRKAAAMDVDPRFVEVSIVRWQRFTNRLATLDGKTLDQVAAARRKGKAKRETEDERDVRIARKRLAEIKEHPEQLISGDKLRARLEKLS